MSARLYLTIDAVFATLYALAFLIVPVQASLFFSDFAEARGVVPAVLRRCRISMGFDRVVREGLAGLACGARLAQRQRLGQRGCIGVSSDWCGLPGSAGEHGSVTRDTVRSQKYESCGLDTNQLPISPAPRSRFGFLFPLAARRTLRKLCGPSIIYSQRGSLERRNPGLQADCGTTAAATTSASVRRAIVMRSQAIDGRSASNSQISHSTTVLDTGGVGSRPQLASVL